MQDVVPSGASGFWTMVGAVVAAATLLGSMVIGGVRWLRGTIGQKIEEEIAPVRRENERLRTALEQRFRFPRYAKDVIELTETAAGRKIQELEERYQQALDERNQQGAEALQEQLQEINSLRLQLSKASEDRAELEERLQNAVFATPPREGSNALGLPTGLILIVRYNGCYGAAQAVDQSSMERGAFIRYAWWYQPDGSGVFTTPTTEFGFAEDREGQGGSPQLEIGPIHLQWSISGDGIGWVYFGPRTNGSSEYELAVTDQIDISRVDAEKYDLVKHERFRAPSATPHGV